MIRLFAALLLLCAPLWLTAEDTSADAFLWNCSVKQEASGEYLVSVTCNIAEKAYLYSSMTAVQAVFADGSMLAFSALTPTTEHAEEAIYPSGSAVWQIVASQKPTHIQVEFQG